MSKKGQLEIAGSPPESEIYEVGTFFSDAFSDGLVKKSYIPPASEPSSLLAFTELSVLSLLSLLNR